MKIDFNKQVVYLDGAEMQGDSGHLGKIIANQLAYSSTGPLVKLMDWARDLYKGNPLELDRTDADVLKSLIEALPLPNISKELAVSTIESAKSQNDKKS